MIGEAFVSIGEESGFVPLLGPGTAQALPPLNAVLFVDLLLALLCFGGRDGRFPLASPMSW